MARPGSSVEFVETDRFTKNRERLVTDDELRQFQLELIADPTAGDVIRGAGGFRKVRIATRRRGRRASARVIYFLVTRSDQILLYDIYEKSEEDSLSKEERNELKTVSQYLKSDT